jgi:hypothetical protein
MRSHKNQSKNNARARKVSTTVSDTVASLLAAARQELDGLQSGDALGSACVRQSVTKATAHRVGRYGLHRLTGNDVPSWSNCCGRFAHRIDAEAVADFATVWGSVGYQIVDGYLW